MRRTPAFVVAALVAVVALDPAAQARPSFAGRWTSASDPDAAPGVGQRGAPGQRAGGRGARAGDMGSGWGSTIAITQDASHLTVEYQFFARGDLQPPLKFTYALDGSETRNRVMMGRGIQEQRSTVRWDGDRLVIITVHALTDPASGTDLPVEVTQTLSLEAPASLVVETTRGAVLGGQATTTRTVYRKVS